MRELLLPRTDAGALVQLVLAVVVFGALLVVVRRDRDLRFLVGAGAFAVLAFLALRAAH